MLNRTLSHYRVVEQIGAGGMGIVYRARDEHLERDVAIKVLSKGLLADDGSRKRFRNEALSLARLNHPNIAIVHEFSTQDDIDFLVTEYIVGTTLDSKLGRGPLSTKEVIDLGMQLALGLSAAHEQSIVHRDLKPANLRITSDGRLKILDFGLAQLAPHPSEQGLTLTLTKSQELTGTLPYMAPEQLRGEVVDERSDIWSAGAVLYEMASGKRPFPQANSPLLINAILNQPPQPPKSINASIPAELERIVLKALDKDPGHRYQSARELGIDLQRLHSGTAPILAPRTPRKLAAAVIAAALGVLAFALVVFWVIRGAKRSSLSPVAAVPHRRSVAVVGFKNVIGKPEVAWLSTAISEMLTTELGSGNQLRTISGENVAQARAGLGLSEAENLNQAALTHLRENLGADDVVVGSYVPLSDGVIRFDLRLQDTLAGEIVASVSEKGSVSQIDEMVSKAGAELRTRLGVAELSDADSANVRAALPSNPEAARLYSEGLERLRFFDALSARGLLEKASALDPNHAPTHSALAQAWSALGYDEKAKAEAKRALDLDASFSREDKLSIEGRYHELTQNWGEAADSYRTLWDFFPDKVDYGLQYARAQTRSNRSEDALATIAALRKLAVSKGEAARIDLTEALVASARSDYKLQYSAADRAVQEGQAVGASLLVAGALKVEGSALQRLGQPEKSSPLIEQARDLYSSAGDRAGAANCTLLLADRLYDEGHFESARNLYDTALPVFREIGDQHGIRSTLERIGNSFYDQGKLLQAKDYYQQSLAVDLELRNASDLASDYGNLANAMDALGDLTGSQKMQEQALASFQKSGERRGTAVTLGNLGNLMIELGEPEAARKYCDQALSMMREISYISGQSYPTSCLGDALFFQGDVTGARKQYEAALKLSQDAQQEDHAAQVQTSLAVVALEEKRFADAESLAGTSVTVFDKDKAADNGAWARAVLVQTLLAEGKIAEAESLARQALTLSRQASSQPQQFEASLADARAKLRSGKMAEANKELQSVQSSALKSGYRYYEYQAGLDLAEAELVSGSPQAKPHLAMLEKDARKHGLILLAKHAQVLSARK